jgi:hypothetical protein
MFDWIAVLAAALMVMALAVCLVTRSWLPRVSSVASGTMAVCLGIVSLWAAFTALDKGVFEGAAASRILEHNIYRARSPVSFWMFFTLFALPGFLLVTYPIYAAVSDVILWIQSAPNIAKPGAMSSGDSKDKTLR